MIDVKEIRVGNYFTGYDGKPFQWGIGDFIALLTQDIDERIKSPIALTPEVLTAAGFEEHIPFVYDLKYKDKRFRFQQVDEGWAFIYGVGKNVWYDAETEIQYLHDLQNLYFALTKSELEILL